MSSALLRAAVSGLLGMSVVACDDDDPKPEEDPSPQPNEQMCECGPDAGEGQATVDAGATQCVADAGTGDAGEPMEEVKEIGDPEMIKLTWDQLNEKCDDRGGYIQIHASCPGTNACAGFSYGDWGEASEVQEHSCSGVNGCAGLSCVDAAEGSDMTGEEIMKLEEDFYIERAGAYGPDPCRTCHVPSEYDEDLETYVYDHTKLRMLFWPEGGRDASNWKERSAAYQERIVAFGANSVSEDGIAYAHMSAYYKFFSKTEIQRVVEYMRSFAEEDTVVKVIKVHPGFVEGEGDH